MTKSKPTNDFAKRFKDGVDQMKSLMTEGDKLGYDCSFNINPVGEENGVRIWNANYNIQTKPQLIAKG